MSILMTNNLQLIANNQSDIFRHQLLVISYKLKMLKGGGYE